jgi:hypothetical protein
MAKNIFEVPAVPVNYDLTGKKLMVHDLTALPAVSTKLIDAEEIVPEFEFDPNDFEGAGTALDKFRLKNPSAGQSQTPLLQNVDGAQFGISNLSSLQVQKVTPATQNLVLSSRDLSNGTYWEVASNIAAVATTEDGTLGTDTLYLMTGSNAGDNFFHQTVTVVPGTEYFLYMDVRRGTNTAHTFSVRDLINFVDIIAPTDIFSSTGGTVIRLMFSFTAPAGCTSVRIFPVRNLTGNLYLADIQLTSVENAEYAVTTSTPVIIANSVTPVILTDSNGNIAIGTNPIMGTKLYVAGLTEINGLLRLTGGHFKTLLVTVPAQNEQATSNDIGKIHWDDNYMYVCVGINYWKRVSLVEFADYASTSVSGSSYNLPANSPSKIFLSSGGGAFDLNLPAASTVVGKIFTLKNVGIHPITVKANGVETIDGATTYPLTTQWQSCTLQAVTGEWYIINKV